MPGGSGDGRSATSGGDPTPEPQPQGTFSSLRFPLHRMLWFSGLFTFFAVMGQNVARGWLAYQITGSNSGLGGVFLGFGLAMLVGTPFGGVAADRLPKRSVIRLAQVLLVVSSAWIGFAVAFDVIAYWMLVGASAVQALGFALYGPARFAFISELVDRSHFHNAVVVGQVSTMSMQVIGPGVVGLLLGVRFVGVTGVFFFTTVLLIVGMVLTVPLPRGAPAPGGPKQSPFASIADGLGHVWTHPELKILTATTLFVVMIGFPYLAFLPTLASEVFDVGSGGYGAMSAVGAMGGVAAGLAGSRYLARRDPWSVVAGGGAAFVAGLLALALVPTFATALVVLAWLGAGGLVFQTAIQSLLLSISSSEYHGRLQSIVMLGFSGFGLVALPLGVLADAIGIRLTLALMSAAALGVLSLYIAAWRVLRRATPAPGGP